MITLQMLNTIKEIKENDQWGARDHSGKMPGLRTTDLTTMLSNAGSHDLEHVVNKRNSETSLNPRSLTEMDHDRRNEMDHPRRNRDHDINDDIGRK